MAMGNRSRRTVSNRLLATLLVVSCLPFVVGCNPGLTVAVGISTFMAITNAMTPARAMAGAAFMALVQAI